MSKKQSYFSYNDGVDMFDEQLYEMLMRKQGFVKSFVTRSYSTNNKNVPLHTHPHYTENDFKHEQTVFGKEISGLTYDYDDRLIQWDYNKHKHALKKANESNHAEYSCRYYEVYLSAYYEKDIEIFHIVAGVNQSNGYSYCAFGYKERQAK